MSEWTQRFKYTEADILANAPKVAGVYRLIYFSKEQYFVFYVGKSDSLSIGLIEHLGDSESNKCIKKYLSEYSCFFRYLKVEIDSERERIEKQQIEEFHPTCNVQNT